MCFPRPSARLGRKGIGWCLRSRRMKRSVSCLALARVLGLPAVTADPAWSTLQVGLVIQLIR